MGRRTFAEAERQCELTFSMSGRWYHLYTSGKTTESFLKDDKDFKYCMNLMARCAIELPELVIVAFAIMDNHIHIVLAGDRAEIELFFMTYRRRLSRYLSVKYRQTVPSTFQMMLKDISDLKSLRNTIAYVNRNGYVASPCFTPFSYPWGTGTVYFNVTVQNECLSSLTIECQRAFFRGRIPSGLENCRITDGYITADSFCSIKLGMSFFRDAHQYFSLISKSVESYGQLAADLDDGEFLTDQELFQELVKILNERYDGSRIGSLSKAQRLDLARTLHFQFHSSNGQVRRLLGLTQYEVDQMFPKAKQ